MHRLIADKKEEIAEVCSKYDVVKLEIYGSAARGTDFDPDTSDADFLVEYNPPLLPGLFKRYFGMISDLEDVLDRNVDLTRKGVITNPYLKVSIEEDCEVIYETRSPEVAE